MLIQRLLPWSLLAVILVIAPAASAADGLTLAADGTGFPLATTTAFTATGGTFGATRLTARVSAGGATPAGAVTFLEGSAVLGSAGLDGGGQAVLAAPGLEAGSHVLVAQFNGNRAFLASASSATGLQVDPAATGVTLGSDSPSLPSGAVATLTATVTSLAGIPTGTVVFLDGSDPLGTVPLSGNIAVCSARLRPGSRSLTAVFQGSRDYLASTSATLAMAVTLSFSLAPRGDPGEPGRRTNGLPPGDRQRRGRPHRSGDPPLPGAAAWAQRHLHPGPGAGGRLGHSLLG